jgi:hypothetical protein
VHEPTAAWSRLARLANEWTEGILPAGGALAALLAIAPKVGLVGTALSEHLANPRSSAPRFAGYFGLVFATVCALIGTAAAAALLLALARARRRWLAAAGILVVVAILGAMRAKWLALAAPAAVVAFSPWLLTGAVRTVPSRWREPRMLAVCLACEGACLGVGAWLPISTSVPALLLPMMAAPAALALYAGAKRERAEWSWRAAVASLPMLALPFVGLVRNPTLNPALACVLLAMAGTVALSAFPTVAAPLVRWARRHAIVLAVPAVALVLVLPWHFRDMKSADFAGHESQHLGWINSISYGKLMMADAGFTYGPMREYTLALLAWLQGGLTLEHVRLAHVAVNVAGLLCLFAAMRRVCAGQTHLLIVGAGLLLAHSAITSLVVYTSTYSFGWADASRAGLATLSVVVALARWDMDSPYHRRRLRAGGALAALSCLYSHDFGVPAVLATWAGLALELLRRERPLVPLRVRARRALKNVGHYALGFAAVAVPFLAVYAAKGKLGAFLEGYRWTVGVSSSTAPFAGPTWWLSNEHFSSYERLTSRADSDSTVGARVLDFALGPGLAIAGLAHVLTAIVRRRVTQRTVVIAALATVVAMAMHHAFLASDAWHIANSSTPGLVMMIALATSSGRLYLRAPARSGLELRKAVLPVGLVCALIVPLGWLAHGAPEPVNTRLAAVAAGEERPSFGPKYSYPDVPRAGDEHIGDEHLSLVRWVRSHSRPDDPVLCATWLLGGGIEAFLSQRRNPTSFDKPDEVVSEPLQKRAYDELQRDPPALIVGSHFDEFGAEVNAFIAHGWAPSPQQGIMVRRN